MCELKFKELRFTSGGTNPTTYALELEADNLPEYSTFKEVARQNCYCNGKKYGELFIKQSVEDPRFYSFGFNEFKDGQLNEYNWSSNPDSINTAFGTNLVNVCINNNGWIAMKKEDAEALLPEGYKFYGEDVMKEMHFQDHEFDPTKWEYMPVSDYSSSLLTNWSRLSKPVDLTTVQVRLCLDDEKLYYII